MPPTTDPFDTRTFGDTTIVVLRADSLVKRGDLEVVCNAIDKIIDSQKQPNLVLSFENITHVSSNFLGRLIAFHKRVKSKGGDLSLAEVNPRIREILRLTKLDTQIDVQGASDPSAGEPAGAHGKRVWVLVAAAAAVALALVVIWLMR